MCLKYRFAKIFGITSFACWNMLGFKRGLDYYDYFNDKNNYLYSISFKEGLKGVWLYTFVSPFMVFKELYRLEVNIRGLKKDSDYYSLP